MSHPVWVRGLKQELHQEQGREEIVAPRVGAWIETLRNEFSARVHKVAPRVGAWIETLHRSLVR